jgi:O-antigen biosynthesis protein WbqP
MPAFKRAFDLSLSVILLVMLLPLLIAIAIVVKVTSFGPALHWSDRVGRDGRIFKMPKFRTMHVNTPQVAPHLLVNPKRFLTPIGGFLRRTSLDELPQLFSILSGDLSFVGPRPALFNEDNLIDMRSRLGINRLTPGLTGWAQVNGRGELANSVKVDFDFEYLQRKSTRMDLYILFLTIGTVIRGKGIRH